jgi:hypothetical protein
MKPLVTIHAGEYLVGAYIEQHFKRINVWIPLRDTGIDLLVSDRRNGRSLSLQVKFSKDFLVTHMGPAFQKQLRACGWWTINREKLRTSPADYWCGSQICEGRLGTYRDCCSGLANQGQPSMLPVEFSIQARLRHGRERGKPT